MAWTTPQSWTDVTLTSSTLNTQVRDNFDWLGTSKPVWSLEVTGFSISSAAGYTNVTFASEIFDNSGLHSTSTNTDRVTIATAGKYCVIGYVEWQANATAPRDLAIRKTSTVLTADVRMPVSSGYCAASIVWFGSLSVSDYLVLSAGQTSGSSLTATFRFQGFWIGT